MTPQLQPLMSLLSQTERERDEALAAQARAAAQHQAAIEQTRQLLDYRKEYEQRWGTQFKQNSSIELVNCYHAFTGRLSQAVAHQERTEAMAAQQLELISAQVQACELRVASVRKLIERRMNEQRMHAERADQKITDEFAARTHWNARRQAPNTTY